jgi:hypothetical protein
MGVTSNPTYGGQDAGIHEVHTTTPLEAKRVAEEILGPVDDIIPEFSSNYEVLSSLMSLSRGLKRSEMPVISPSQAGGFVEKLRNGDLGSYGKLVIPEEKVTARDLKPIQGQVYLDNALGKIKDFGVVLPGSQITTKPLIASMDNDIIDGHHKWAATIISNPNTQLTVFKVPLPVQELLSIAMAYGESLGNTKNK